MVARASRRFPFLLDVLAEGRLHLTALAMLANHLTDDNVHELIDAATGLSKRQLEVMLADRAPKPAAPTRIRRKPERPEASDPTAGGAAPAASPPPASPPQPPAGPLFASAVGASDNPAPFPGTVPAPKRDDRVDPLGQARFKVQFTASTEWVDKLREAQDLLAHRIPDGDVAGILDEALSLLLDKVHKERFALLDEDTPATTRQPSGKPTPTRRIPNAIKRAVYERDDGCCTFVDSRGRRCGERRFIEYHHLDPWGRGGEHSVANITLRCRAHNMHAARVDYGAEHIAAKVNAQRSLFPSSGPPG